MVGCGCQRLCMQGGGAGGGSTSLSLSLSSVSGFLWQAGVGARVRRSENESVVGRREEKNHPSSALTAKCTDLR